jgi:hypothetical protein
MSNHENLSNTKGDPREDDPGYIVLERNHEQAWRPTGPISTTLPYQAAHGRRSSTTPLITGQARSRPPGPECYLANLFARSSSTTYP